MDTGLSLKLDWVKSITGVKIPLRPQRTGGRVAFEAKVYSTKGGIEVFPHVDTPDKMLGEAGKMIIGWELFSTKAFREKRWMTLRAVPWMNALSLSLSRICPERNAFNTAIRISWLRSFARSRSRVRTVAIRSTARW